MEQEYYVYQITCNTTGKFYIGQCQKYKLKDNKPYNYGITGRWCDHVSSSKRSNTPLHTEIREQGADKFEIKSIETTTEDKIDEREAYWINALNACIPNGYNVMRHSRCKHREESTLPMLYVETAESVELKTICKDGSPRLVYLYIKTPDEMKRITFGQKRNTTYEDALNEATRILEVFKENGVLIKEDRRLIYSKQYFKKIRIAQFNKTMVAVYLKKEGENQERVCFGGKTTTFEQALEKAREFVKTLQTKTLEDNL